jgi:hypothetical protein
MSLTRYPYVIEVLRKLNFPETDISVISSFYDIREVAQCTVFKIPFHKIDIQQYFSQQYVSHLPYDTIEPLDLDIFFENKDLHSVCIYYNMNGTRKSIKVHSSLTYLIDSFRKDDSLEFILNKFYSEFDKIQENFELDPFITDTLFDRDFSLLYGTDIERVGVILTNSIAFKVKPFAFKNHWVKLPENLKYFQDMLPTIQIHFDLNLNFTHISFSSSFGLYDKKLILTFNSVLYSERAFIDDIYCIFECNPDGFSESEFVTFRKFRLCNDDNIKELLPEIFMTGPFNTLHSFEERINLAEMLLFK